MKIITRAHIPKHWAQNVLEPRLDRSLEMLCRAGRSKSTQIPVVSHKYKAFTINGNILPAYCPMCMASWMHQLNNMPDGIVRTALIKGFTELEVK